MCIQLHCFPTVGKFNSGEAGVSREALSPPPPVTKQAWLMIIGALLKLRGPTPEKPAHHQYLEFSLSVSLMPVLTPLEVSAKLGGPQLATSPHYC